MTNTPSDAEIEALAAEHLKAFAQFTGAGDVWVEGEVAFARAVLAKWGTPQPVVREPLTDEQWQRITDLTGGRILTQGVKDEIERVIGIKGGQHGTDT